MTSKYSKAHNNKVLDFSFKKAKNCYFFILGGQTVGQIFKYSKNDWSALVFHPKKRSTRLVEHINSRLHCAFYIADHTSYEILDKIQ